MDDESALASWLRTVQDTDLGPRQIIDPARARQPVGAVIKAAGGDLFFDTEPVRFHKLLADLAPDDLKPAGDPGD